MRNDIWHLFKKELREKRRKRLEREREEKAKGKPPWCMDTLVVRHGNVRVTIEDDGRRAGRRAPDRFQVRIWWISDWDNRHTEVKPYLMPKDLFDIPEACRLAAKKLAMVCVQQSTDPIEIYELKQLRKSLMDFVREHKRRHEPVVRFPAALAFVLGVKRKQLVEKFLPGSGAVEKKKKSHLPTGILDSIETILGRKVKG